MDDTSEVTDRSSSPTARRRFPLIVAVIAVGVLSVDQATKAWAVGALTGRGPVDVVGSLLRFELVRNPGAAFSFATGMTWVFTLVATAVVVVIVRVSRKLGSVGWSVALGLLLGGALGNLTDRLLRAPGFAVGHVVDFLELPHWPVFNVADMCIDTAAALIALLAVRGIGIDGTRHRA
jgi:signal peptidase II